MRKITILILLATSLASCKKTARGVKVEGDFAFGKAYGFCLGNCATFYTITNGELYPDDMDRYEGELKFKTTALPTDKYELAKQLLDEFPQYLLDNPNKIFGCPDCTDQGLIYLQLKINGEVKHWNIDPFNVPEQLEDYIQKVTDVMAALQ